MNFLRQYRHFALILACSFMAIGIQAQQKPLTGRAAALKAKESLLIYPFFKGSTNTGVLPVSSPTLPYQHKGKCKLVFDVSYEPEKGQINGGIEEVMRVLNLHGAAGVKKQDLDVYVIFHGPASASFLDDDVYTKQFQVSNPNLPLIKQLQDAGVKLVICGQTLGLRSMNVSSFPDGTLVAYSARTASSDLVQRGYMLYDVSED
ncbi:MAG TPA: DsrE family protein [Chitinophagaceae bacterium]|nr:DsrE family protein [Chitinophagaceae bacterium]